MEKRLKSLPYTRTRLVEIIVKSIIIFFRFLHTTLLSEVRYCGFGGVPRRIGAKIRFGDGPGGIHADRAVDVYIPAAILPKVVLFEVQQHKTRVLAESQTEDIQNGGQRAAAKWRRRPAYGLD